MKPRMDSLFPKVAKTPLHDHHHAEFKLSITKALGDQLSRSLSELEPAPLNGPNIESVRRLPGVYQLWHENELVYIGKADKSIPTRLWKHHRKLSGRIGISLKDMAFTALYVEEDFSAVAPEKLLIDRFQESGAIPWNNNGFGINDPGKERDTTIFDESHFDCRYPANLDFNIPEMEPGKHTLEDLLKKTKESLPYNFRYANGKKEKELYANTTVTTTTETQTADDVFLLISSTLPATWRVVALPGYAILYPREAEYKSARRIYLEGSIQIPPHTSNLA